MSDEEIIDRYRFLHRQKRGAQMEVIAKQCGFSESKVKSMLMRVRNRLCDHLIKDGILEA